MSQSSQNKKASSDSPAKKFRLHKRTIAAIFCVVLLPWVLIAVPATVTGGGGTTGLNINHSVHGWPWVHLESTEYDVYGNWVNKKFIPGQMPAGLDLVESSRNAAAGFTKDKPSVQWNLRLEPDDWQAEDISGQAGYWSEPTVWPAWEDKTHLTPRYVGLLLNMIVVALLAGLVAAFCEYRIRHHQRLLKFSLAKMLIAVAVCVVAMGWFTNALRENAAQVRLDDAIQALESASNPDSSLWGFQREYEAPFPLIVSQFFNHGKHPWGEVPFFCRVKAGKIDVDIDLDSEDQDIEKIVELAKATQYSVYLRVDWFSPQRQRMLRSFSGTNIVELSLNFDASRWMQDEFGDSDWQQGLKQSGFKVDLDFEMSNLEELELELDFIIPQAQQLQPFVDLPSLKSVTIAWLSTAGAEFILETKDRWPKVMDFEFQDDVPEELQQKLLGEFERSAEDLD